MNHRIEKQNRASWSYNYTLWTMNFRDQFNCNRMVYLLALARAPNEASMVTPAVVANACEGIAKTLKGTYITPDNRRLPVQRDITKAIYAPGLSVVARRLLFDVAAVSRDSGGTQEVRRRARSITNSIRTGYRLPSFTTLTSDENHKAIMSRLARLLESDPAYKHCSVDVQRWYGRLQPPLQAWNTRNDHETPSYAVRRSILVNSAVNAVDGFKVHTRLAFKHCTRHANIFGLPRLLPF